MVLLYVCLYMHNMCVYVTGVAKRNLPHTANSMNLEDHNFVQERYKPEISPSVNLCWCSLLSNFQGNNLFQSEVMNCQSS